MLYQHFQTLVTAFAAQSRHCMQTKTAPEGAI